MRRRRWALLGLVLAAVSLVSVAALARPGGGHSYSGGGSSGGSGGGGDDGILFALIALAIEEPVIGVPLLIIFLCIAYVRHRMKEKQKAWQTSAAGVPYVQQQMMAAATVPRVALEDIRGIDPGFSGVLFEDFAYCLYAELQRARAAGTAKISAFISPQLAQALVNPMLADVRGVIIGAMRILRFSGVHVPAVQIELEFEVNYVEVGRQGGEQRFYAVDRMGLSRARTAKSRPAERARTLDCPNCGASIENIRGTQCAYCKEEVGGGRFDWNVDYLSTVSRQPRGPLLTSDVAEVGTDFPTRVDPGAASRASMLRDFDWNVFQTRVGHIFGELQKGWTRRDAALIRPFVSDNLFQSMMYWIDLYLQNRCRNVTEGSRVLRMDLANALIDATYEAVTVRVWAEGPDYTIGDDNRLLSGNQHKPRTYSEYWTLIRGVHRKGASKGDQSCPNCGAPLKISMVGNCEHCRVKVTAGEFDWVLSRIEQDESYTG